MKGKYLEKLARFKMNYEMKTNLNDHLYHKESPERNSKWWKATR
jgi:hypothetical protein